LTKTVEVGGVWESMPESDDCGCSQSRNSNNTKS